MTKRYPPSRRDHLTAINAALDFYNVPAEVGRNELKPARKKCALTGAPRASEHQLQVALIQWWSHACKGYGLPEFALFACPSGGARDPITGARLKAEGARRGVPDLILAVPRGVHHGAFIEMKIPGNKPSQEQVEFMRYLEGAGYRCAVCWSTEAAIREIECYLALEPGMALAHQMSLPA